MRKTYAPNGIIFGFMAGLLVAVKVNVILGIIAGVIVSVICWALIRFIEGAMYHAADAAEDAVRKKYREYKDKDKNK